MLKRAKGVAIVTSIILAGCASHVDDKLIASSEFATSGNGVAVIDFTPVAHNCRGDFTADFGKYDSSTSTWRFHSAAKVDALGLFDSGDPDKATEVVLPAGEYGLVEMRCALYRRNIRMTAAGIILFKGYRRAIATFSIGTGEVVDLGSVNALNTGATHFSPVFGPMTPRIRAGLAATRPKLASAMISRPMIPFGPPPSQPAAPPAEGAAPLQ